jgi:hypothetical protein
MEPDLDYIEASPESWGLVQKLTQWVAETDGAALMVHIYVPGVNGREGLGTDCKTI